MKKNILQLLEETACNFPNNVALKDEKREVTFSDYLNEAKKIGSHLLSIGNAHYSQPIIVFVDRRVESIISFMGVLYTRNFYVPVDSKTPIERLKVIVSVLNPVAVIGFNEYEKSLVDQLDNQISYFDYKQLVSSQSDDYNLWNIREKALDVDPAYAIFTSGSTGIPKAVLIAHRSVLDLANWLVKTFDFNSSDIIGNQTPFYFDASVKDIYISLMTGSTLFIIPQKCFSFPKLLSDVLIENRITTILWATSAVVLVAKSGILDELKLDSLRRVFFAGEAMFGKHLNIWKKAFTNCNFINLYGPTEVTVDSTYYLVNRDFQDSDVIPIGHHCDNKEVFLLDENNKIVINGKEGELAVKGTGIALGYYNNPEQTNNAFIQNPLHNNFRDILYKTGDYVKINEFGEIEFIGRKDFQIKHQGNRIELGEIEAAAYGLIQVEHVACIYDDVNSKIVLFYSSETQIEPSEFIKELSKSIPKYMYPTRFEYIKEMPLNANSKVDRKAIKLLLNEEN